MSSRALVVDTTAKQIIRGWDEDNCEMLVVDAFFRTGKNFRKTWRHDSTRCFHGDVRRGTIIRKTINEILVNLNRIHVLALARLATLQVPLFKKKFVIGENTNCL